MELDFNSLISGYEQYEDIYRDIATKALKYLSIKCICLQTNIYFIETFILKVYEVKFRKIKPQHNIKRDS